jgi:hypothetical protein
MVSVPLYVRLGGPVGDAAAALDMAALILPTRAVAHRGYVHALPARLVVPLAVDLAIIVPSPYLGFSIYWLADL